MSKGFDASTSCAALAAQIKAAGFDFVARYYSHTAAKSLTLKEAQALCAADLKLVTVWETRPTQDSFFSRARGVADGHDAGLQALAIGQPAGSAIYFAVDYDASAAATNGVISDYFRGVAEGLISVHAGQFQIGVYGSGLVCGRLLQLGLAHYAWLAQSRGWAGYNSFQHWHIKQGPETTMLGLDVDTDEATPDCGDFSVKLGAAPAYAA